MSAWNWAVGERSLKREVYRKSDRIKEKERIRLLE